MKTPPVSWRLLLVVLAANLAPLLHAAADYSTPYFFTTLAGESSIGNRDGTAAAARFNRPRDVATDSLGNLFVVDKGNHTIRKITPAGVVTTFAGTTSGEPGSADGTGSAARFHSPESIVADAADNLFVADTGNHTIRKITPSGVVTTFAGQAGVPGAADGLGAAARFNAPVRIAIAPSGNLYVADSSNHVIRMITAAGSVSRFATAHFGGLFSEDRSIPFYSLGTDNAGNVYAGFYRGGDTVTHQATWDDNYTIHTGHVSQVAADGVLHERWFTAWTQYFDGRIINHLCSDFFFDGPDSVIAVDGPSLRRGAVADFRFKPLAGDSTPGYVDGPASAARFGYPLSLAPDRNGALYIVDTDNNVVRKLANGDVTTVAGVALERVSVHADGAGSAARFVTPAGVAVNATGTVFIADANAHCIRRLTPDGIVTTFAGAPGVTGFANGPGAEARFSEPRAIAVDASGNLFVADYGNDAIRWIDPHGYVNTVGDSVRIKFPVAVAVSPGGSIYVASETEHAVRMLTPAGVMSIYAGDVSHSGSADGNRLSARFRFPSALATGPLGELYVAETNNLADQLSRIRSISADGVVTTLAGGKVGYADGDGAAARFDSPSALAVDREGNVFVVDHGNHAIRRISPRGAVTTLAGLASTSGSTDGVGRAARFHYPTALALDSAGALYVTSGPTVRKGVLATGPAITAPPASQAANAGANVTFSVTAIGTPAPTYQWQINGQPFSGATSNTLTLTNVRPEDAGDYTVVVTNDLGSVTSSKATLTVTAASTPPSAGGGGNTGGGGGGAPSVWFVLMIAVLALFRFARRFAETCSA